MSIEVIRIIIRNMSEERFNVIVNAENDYWDLDKRVSRLGYKRMVYNLRKEGLTVRDWLEWCAE